MTWHDLSWAFGDALPHSDMNALQANFGAMAAGDSGAPAVQMGAFLNTGSYSTVNFVFSIDSGDTWTIPQGVIHVTCTDGFLVNSSFTYMGLEASVGGTWRRVGDVYGLNFFPSDGSSFRLRDINGKAPVIQYWKLW